MLLLPSSLEPIRPQGTDVVPAVCAASLGLDSLQPSSAGTGRCGPSAHIRCASPRPTATRGAPHSAGSAPAPAHTQAFSTSRSSLGVYARFEVYCAWMVTPMPRPALQLPDDFPPSANTPQLGLTILPPPLPFPLPPRQIPPRRHFCRLHPHPHRTPPPFPRGIPRPSPLPHAGGAVRAQANCLAMTS